jgi:hypothetical protein
MSPDILRRAHYENLATLAAIVAVVIGLYALGAGGYSAVGFILLLNINSFKRVKEDAKE